MTQASVRAHLSRETALKQPSPLQLAVATLETDLDGALVLGRQALALAEAGRNVLLSATFEAEALVLGALQLESTLRGRSPARFDVPIVRRSTTGTEAQLSGKVLYHALALPRVDSLFPDASPRTLLNRNLRAFLRGYTAASVPLRYFGTEVLSLLGHPVALVGYDQSAVGAVLIEVLIGLESPCVVRPALKREPPEALYRLLRSEPSSPDLLQRAVHGIVTRLGATQVALAELPRPVANRPELGALTPQASVSIPLGVIEAVSLPAVRVLGDMLVGSAVLERVAVAAQGAHEAGQALANDVLAALQGAPLDGARPADVVAVLEQAFSPGP